MSNYIEILVIYCIIMSIQCNPWIDSKWSIPGLQRIIFLFLCCYTYLSCSILPFKWEICGIYFLSLFLFSVLEIMSPSKAEACEEKKGHLKFNIVKALSVEWYLSTLFLVSGQMKLLYTATNNGQSNAFCWVPIQEGFLILKNLLFGETWTNDSQTRSQDVKYPEGRIFILYSFSSSQINESILSKKHGLTLEKIKPYYFIFLFTFFILLHIFISFRLVQSWS